MLSPNMTKFFHVHAHLKYTPVWRLLRVRADHSFEDLHLMLQHAFGWDNAHLYAFYKGRKEIATCPGSDSFSPEPAPSADEVLVGEALKKKGSTCQYMYDFGDSWEVELKVESSESAARDGHWLLAGEMASPPEDCGGMPGYERLVEFCKTGVDPYGEDPEDLREWLGDWDPDAFSVDELDQQAGAFEIDVETLDETALAILSLTLHAEGRVWKGLDWSLMERLHERGWIHDPKTKAKSVLMTDKGIRLAKRFLKEYFAA